MPHITPSESVLRCYEGTPGQVNHTYFPDRDQMATVGYTATELRRVVRKRFLQPDLVRVDVRYDYQRAPAEWTGLLCVGDFFEAAWRDKGEARHLLQRLRVERKKLLALKRDQRAVAREARGRLRAGYAKTAMADYQREADALAAAATYETRVANLDVVARAIERWMLDV